MVSQEVDFGKIELTITRDEGDPFFRRGGESSFESSSVAAVGVVFHEPEVGDVGTQLTGDESGAVLAAVIDQDNLIVHFPLHRYC